MMSFRHQTMTDRPSFGFYKQNTHAHTFSPAALLLLVLLLLLIWFHTDYGKQQKAASEEGEKENREAGGVGSTL